MMSKLRQRQEWRFFGVLPQADLPMAVAWWVVLVLRGLLPAGFAIAMGILVGAVENGHDLVGPLAVIGVVFVLLQVLSPVHTALSASLGDRTAAWLHDRLTEACIDPPGMGHLEDPTLTTDLTAAREFELGMSGPPLSMGMDFIAGGLVEMLGGVASAAVLFGYAWWAPIVLGGGWLTTHWLLKESAVWRDRNTEEVRAAQRDAQYAYRLAVDPPAAKELRMFGLAGWTLERFIARRTLLHELQYRATRLRERSVLASLAIVGTANIVVFWSLADAAAGGHLGLGSIVVYAQAAVGASMIAFGGLNWALDGAAAPVAAVLRLRPAMAPAGALASGTQSAKGRPGRELRFRNVTFGYPASATPILRDFDLTIPAGSSIAIVGQNGAGKTTLAKLLCRLYDPQVGAIEADGVDLKDFDLASWRQQVTAVFQDFIRFELSLRDNVAPEGNASDEAVRAALADAGASDLADLAGLDTILAKGYDGGTDLSGGQWQRVALARALSAVRVGAGVVILDEPTAQLDVRGEAEIFERILKATRQCTTILISHRFSTVRQADRICVLELGRVIELGTHDELIALGGRYRTMYELQAQRFSQGGAEEGGRKPSMTSSRKRGVRTPDNDLPPALSSMWRLCKLGYQHEPGLIVVAFLLSLLAAVPDALIAVWLKLLGEGVLQHRRSLITVAAIGMGLSAVATWLLRIVSTRVQRRFRDKVTIALESHVARLQATVVTIAHQERPDYLDRLSVLRDQIFVLDHMYMSLFSTCGWILRLGITVALLMSVHPALALLAVFAVPTVLSSTWRPAVERAAFEKGAPSERLAKHLFTLATTAPPGKEVRVTGIGPRLANDRRAAWERWYGLVAAARWRSAAWHTLAWAVFGGAFVGAIVFVAKGLHSPPQDVLLVVAAASRLSSYIGATVGEIGFLRGIWMDGSRRLAWLEDYAASLTLGADVAVPERIEEGITFEDVSFAYPGTTRLVLEKVNLTLPAGVVVAVVGENGAGKTTLVKLLSKFYLPTSGRILVDGQDLARMPAEEWRTRLAGAYQDFFRFELLARQTVGLGDVERLDDGPAVATAIERAGADDVIDRLAAGLETQLGPTWPEGVEVSFGQWQKLALARGFMRDHPLVLVLDEPTAALDAETEHALFERYAAGARGGGSQGAEDSQGVGDGEAGGRNGSGDGRITILVSHRFSTVRMADLIVVLDGARVVEVGTHEDLMVRGGQYAELYGIQAAAYQ